MGLEKIREEILQKATAAEKEIIADASLKVEAVKKDAVRQIGQLEQDASRKLNLEIAALESRENSLASMESQKMLFQAKKEALDAVYQGALVRIKKMSKKEREQVIAKLLERAKKEIDVHTVYVNDTDRAFIGSSFEIKSLATDGGIICETKDGRVRVDYTFSTLFADIKEKTVKEASKTLFG